MKEKFIFVALGALLIVPFMSFGIKYQENPFISWEVYFMFVVWILFLIGVNKLK
jgi:hypothetical protein